MDLEKALDKIVFELTPFPANHELIAYMDEDKKIHKVIVDELDEEENAGYCVSFCETLLRITIDDTYTYLVQVANRLYVYEDDYYDLADWMEF